jgi:hypothetical protein
MIIYNSYQILKMRNPTKQTCHNFHLYLKNNNNYKDSIHNHLFLILIRAHIYKIKTSNHI